MRPIPPGDGPVFPSGIPRSFVFALIVVFVLLIAGYQSVSIYVETLWYETLGFASVYWFQLKAQSLTFLAFFAATAAILWGMFLLVIPGTRGHRQPFMILNGRPVYLPGLDAARRLAKPVAVIAAVLLGLIFSSEWMTFALYLNKSGGEASPDPIFGKPLSFYFFTLPMLSVIGGWLMAIAVIVMLAAMVL